MDNSRKDRHQAALIDLGRFLAFTLSIWSGLASAQQGGPLVMTGLAEQVTLIEEVSLTGTVISPHIAELSTEVSGIVETMEIELGDQLQVGDKILQLNSELAALSLVAASAATEQAIQEWEDAKRRLTDVKALAKRNSVSANEIESLAAEVRIDNAVLKRFRAEQQQRAAQLQRHNLSAPFAGVISRKLVEVGEWIQPGKPVVELIATTDLRIDFQVPQSVYAKLGQATDVRIKLDALPGNSFDGAIETVIPVTDPATRTFLIRAVLNDPAVKLAPGMSASAVLRLSTGTQGIVVPRDALIRYPDGRITVWVINQEGDRVWVSERQVKIGSNFGGMVTIIGGLSSDTPIVVQGNEALRERQDVIIKRTE